MAADANPDVTFGLGLASTAAQIGGGLGFVYGLSPMSGHMGSVFMGLGAVVGVAGISLGIANMKK
ncbi:MAG: hypothetical protein WC492_04360 [Candidatus Micrarchaeia archaeon]